MCGKITFLFVCLAACKVNSQEFLSENGEFESQIRAVLDYLNDKPAKVYLYNKGSLVSAQNKPDDITELLLDVTVNCIEIYPGLPCSPQTQTCHAFVKKNVEQESYQVLSDVTCSPKVEISVENVDEGKEGPPMVQVPETLGENRNLDLSVEPVSKEQGIDFVAIRKNSVPCLGCPYDLNTDAIGVEDLLNTALRHIETEKSQRHTVVNVRRLQQQVVAGMKYFVLMEVGPTTCAKDTDVSSPCPLDSSAETSLCQVTFIEKPWISKVKHIIQNNCTVSQEYSPKGDDIDNDLSAFGGLKKSTEKPKTTYNALAKGDSNDEMNPARLSDLEAQILIDPFFGPVLKKKSQPPASFIDNVDQPVFVERSTLETTPEDRFEPIGTQPTIVDEEEPTIEILLAPPQTDQPNQSTEKNSAENIIEKQQENVKDDAFIIVQDVAYIPKSDDGSEATTKGVDEPDCGGTNTDNTDAKSDESKEEMKNNSSASNSESGSNSKESQGKLNEIKTKGESSDSDSKSSEEKHIEKRETSDSNSDSNSSAEKHNKKREVGDSDSDSDSSEEKRIRKREASDSDSDSDSTEEKHIKKRGVEGLDKSGSDSKSSKSDSKEDKLTKRETHPRMFKREVRNDDVFLSNLEQYAQLHEDQENSVQEANDASDYSDEDDDEEFRRKRDVHSHESTKDDSSESSESGESHEQRNKSVVKREIEDESKTSESKSSETDESNEKKLKLNKRDVGGTSETDSESSGTDELDGLKVLKHILNKRNVDGTSESDSKSSGTDEINGLKHELNKRDVDGTSESDSESSKTDELDELKVLKHILNKRDVDGTSESDSKSSKTDELDELKVLKHILNKRDVDGTSESDSESSKTDELDELKVLKHILNKRDVDGTSESDSESSKTDELDELKVLKHILNKRDVDGTSESDSKSSETKESDEHKPHLSKRDADDNKSDSSKSSKSNESNKSNQSNKSSKSNDDNGNKDKKVDNLDNDNIRKKKRRSVGQLEKINAEEKVIVRDLADFAAAHLDKMDEDNFKRVILQILGAKRIKLDGIYYQIILRLGISVCSEHDNNEKCREKLFTNLTKICKVQVHVEDDYSNPKVVKSQCQNIKKDENDRNRTNYSRYKRQLAGGHNPLPLDDPRVKQFVDASLLHLDSKIEGENKHKAIEVISATKQVVAGMNYNLKVKLGQSKCKKTEPMSADSCELLEGQEPFVCDINVWDRPWLNKRQFTIKCNEKEYTFGSESTRRKRSLLGEKEENLSVVHPKAQQFVKMGLEYLAFKSKYDGRYVLKSINQVSKQGVSGILWGIDTIINICPVYVDQDSICREEVCKFSVYDQSWLIDGLQINIKCSSDQDIYSFKPGSELYENGESPVHKHMAKAFNQFVVKHRKVYKNKDEYNYRMKIFRDNLGTIALLNKYELGTGRYGITQFADMTAKEFSKSHGLRPDLTNENEPPFMQARIPNIPLPTEFDWRNKGAVSVVKDQGTCGSCWAFSVTGNVEGQYAIKHGKLLSLSEQELVDCDKVDDGCNGGLMDNAYRVIEKLGGLESESDYPYEAEDEKCHFDKAKVQVQLSGALNISHNETDMAKWLVQNGPISIAINANAMQFYVGGVSHPWKMLCDPKDLDHGVLIVGYGVHNYKLFNRTLPFWTIKNSWGTSWGEQGYYRVYRGDGTCGLNETPSSAIVV